MLPLAVEVPGEWVAGLGAFLGAAGATILAGFKYLYGKLETAQEARVADAKVHAAELKATQDVTLQEVKAQGARDQSSRAELSESLDGVADELRNVGGLVKAQSEEIRRLGDAGGKR